LVLAGTLLGAEADKTALMARGKLLYLQHCVICHQGAGQGSPGTFPPLAQSDYLMANVENGIRPVVEGLSGRITVIWRLPADGATKPEIFARGLRNPFGFCWNDRGELFATENGPDADMPEELNVIARGRHYGFPFQFGATASKPYSYTPDPPGGVTFTAPVINAGPKGGVTGGPISTFDPHSSPAGIIFCGPEFPEGLRHTFLVARFGNLLKRDPDVGFDLLQVRVRKTAAGYEAQTTTWLAPLARPIDLVAFDGAIYILEYSRPLNHKGDVPMLPGRLLELKATSERPRE
jgi:glucose/arabinose dehydrogenase